MIIIGIIFTIMMIYFIRNQIFIDEKQYLKGMIPHHSMAVLMSNKLLEKVKNNDETISRITERLMKNIINGQNDEIRLMKVLLN